MFFFFVSMRDSQNDGETRVEVDMSGDRCPLVLYYPLFSLTYSKKSMRILLPIQIRDPSFGILLTIYHTSTEFTQGDLGGRKTGYFLLT